MSLLDPDVYLFERRITFHTNEISDEVIDPRNVVLVLSFSFVVWLGLSILAKLLRICLVSGVAVISIVTIYLGELTLYVIPIMAFPIIIALFLVKRLKKYDILIPETSLLFGNYLALAVIVLALISLSYSFGILGAGGGFSDYSYLLISVFSWISPVVVFLLVFSFPSKVIWEEIRRKLSFITDKYVLVVQGGNVRRGQKLFALGSAIPLSILIVIIPHISNISGDTPIGVDTVQYVKIVESLSSQQDTNPDENFWLLFRDYSNGDRPLTVMVIFALVSLLNSYFSTVHTIEYVLPMILAPSMTLVIFLLVREITRNDQLALISSFLTAISPQILIGIYAGFYANWLALVIAILSSMFMFGYLRSSKYKFIVLFTLTLVVVIFTHTYTYTIFVIVFVVFLLSSLFFRSFRRKIILMLFVAIVLAVIVDISRSAITGSSSGVALNLGVAERTEAGVSQFPYRWSNLVRTVQVHVGGVFGNSIFIMVMAYAGILLLNKKTNLVLLSFLLSFLSIGILPLFFGDRVVMTRVLYNIPLQIPAALTMFWLVRWGSTGVLATFALYLYSFAASARMLTNFQEDVI